MTAQHRPRALESFLCGDWVRGSAEGRPLLDAATGACVATVDDTGRAMAEALAWGRDVGGPALREMTFHQRALMLKALGQALMAEKELFHAESLATGATRADGKGDIEGGIGTLLSYASRGRRELPNARVLVEGPAETLAADHTFSAQHVLTPLTGVAVHINAFNFPCWGMLEKMAPALLAGVPVLVKPASQTAYLTELMVRRILATDLLPEGALQLLCGPAGDLMEHLTGQDVVCFTGSAETGRSLRGHPNVLANSIRFSVEADSLNAAILGPDAVADTPEFELFVKEVVREMTAKAGQKCTAIRRILVPRDQMDAVVGALAERLEAVAVGDPRDPAVAMGPLASLAQRSEVRAGVAALSAEADIVVGDPDAVAPVSGEAGRGAFVGPVLLRCDRPGEARAIHDLEVFGPVATIMPYDGAAEAVALARRGRGALVASLFTDAPEVAEEVVLGLAPFHGRVLIGNRASAGSSTGHGAPLPNLVHGGPGRAGGSEELGGMRAVRHYMQRTAVQGAPRLLSAVTKQWSEGAPAREESEHPFRRPLSRLRIGDRVVTAARRITLEDVEHFARFTGDTFYAHMDEDAARANPFFDGRVAHGYLVLSFAAGLFVDPAPGPVLANYGLEGLRFLAPVYPGDAIQVRLTCKEIDPREGADHGVVRWDCRVTNQTGAIVAQYDLLTMVARDWPM